MEREDHLGTGEVNLWRMGKLSIGRWGSRSSQRRCSENSLNHYGWRNPSQHFDQERQCEGESSENTSREFECYVFYGSGGLMLRSTFNWRWQNFYLFSHLNNGHLWVTNQIDAWFYSSFYTRYKLLFVTIDSVRFVCWAISGCMTTYCYAIYDRFFSYPYFFS